MIVISHWLTFVVIYVILSKINVTNKVGQFKKKTVSLLVLNMSFICDKTSHGKGGMIGTVYRNSSSSTNNNYLSFQIFPPKILQTSSSGARMSYTDLCVPSQAFQ